ncbi:hypothetical protein [Aestuariimicrobium ganziense]|uniref:hypothetical protein n=1 Tax=Aestuariimicrobium ganziense TaxID=2773677 RepID=UPI001944163E|nr:hypothetical protein [Aestuariimicrobium ganziense]
MIVLLQYLAGIVVPLTLFVMVMMRTRPGMVRMLGGFAFAMLTVSGIYNYASAIQPIRNFPFWFQAALSFGGVILAVIAVLIGGIQTQADEDNKPFVAKEDA